MKDIYIFTSNNNKLMKKINQTTINQYHHLKQQQTNEKD